MGKFKTIDTIFVKIQDRSKHFGETMKRILLFLFATFFGGAGFAQSPSYTTISWDTAIEMHRQGGLYLDVRTPEEFSQGTVPEARNIPLQQIQERFAELPKGKSVLVFCRSGVRSQKASEFLVSKGFAVYNIEGGFLKAPPASAFK